MRMRERKSRNWLICITTVSVESNHVLLIMEAEGLKNWIQPRFWLLSFIYFFILFRIIYYVGELFFLVFIPFHFCFLFQRRKNGKQICYSSDNIFFYSTFNFSQFFSSSTSPPPWIAVFYFSILLSLYEFYFSKLYNIFMLLSIFSFNIVCLITVIFSLPFSFHTDLSDGQHITERTNLKIISIRELLPSAYPNDTRKNAKSSSL